MNIYHQFALFLLMATENSIVCMNNNLGNLSYINKCLVVFSLKFLVYTYKDIRG